MCFLLLFSDSNKFTFAFNSAVQLANEVSLMHSPVLLKQLFFFRDHRRSMIRDCKEKSLQKWLKKLLNKFKLNKQLLQAFRRAICISWKPSAISSRYCALFLVYYATASNGIGRAWMQLRINCQLVFFVRRTFFQLHHFCDSCDMWAVHWNSKEIVKTGQYF